MNFAAMMQFARTARSLFGTNPPRLMTRSIEGRGDPRLHRPSDVRSSKGGNAMRLGFLGFVPLFVLLAGASPPEPSGDDLIVHEWGTFLAMGGSDGVVLDGMYHEEHGLPAFVHARGRDQLRAYSALSKGETPVIYFYTSKEQSVRVEVKFPQGLWTQWYPSAAGVFPKFGAMSSADTLRDGRIVWNAAIIPADKSPQPILPATSADALWNFARQVDAAYVQTYNPKKAGPEAMETERYLFYRGLGGVPLPVRFSSNSDGTIGSEASKGVAVRHVFVIRVEKGRAAYAYRSELKAGDEVTGVIPSMDQAGPVKQVADQIANDLESRLVASGLYAKEARAMVNTWRSSYFQTEGIRALFVLPQRWTDEFIPMSIRPAPRELVRVMVGRLELLTPERERISEAAVLALASPDSARRLAGFETLRAQGRYVEPIVRRVLKSSNDPAVKLLCRKLLLAEFVTELRAAVRSMPEPGALPLMMVMNEDKFQIRAQLASLLRSVGLDDEAKAEAGLALSSLKARLAMPKDTCFEKDDLKLEARALEGIGDDRGAARKYGRLIDLAILATEKEDCRKCHRQAQTGPTDLARLRGWWPGDGYVRSLDRAGRRDLAARELETIATKGSLPDDIRVRVRLAYLAEARGLREEAQAIWTKLEAEAPKLATASRP
jgi:hypothetical protein